VLFGLFDHAVIIRSLGIIPLVSIVVQLFNWNMISLPFINRSSLQGSTRRLGRGGTLDRRRGSACGNWDSNWHNGNWNCDRGDSLKLSARRLGRGGALDRRRGSACGNWDSNWHNGNWNCDRGGSLKKSVVGLGGDGEEGDDKDREGLHCEYIDCV
jgi:hypothetical protein